MDQGSTTQQDREWVRLRNQLRDNERIWSGFRQIEVRMIGSPSLPDLIHIITAGIPETFPGIDCVTVACVDPEYEMTRLIEDGAEPGSGARRFIALPREILDGLFTRTTVSFQPSLALDELVITPSKVAGLTIITSE